MRWSYNKVTQKNRPIHYDDCDSVSRELRPQNALFLSGTDRARVVRIIVLNLLTAS